MATDPLIARDALIRQAALDHIRRMQSHDLVLKPRGGQFKRIDGISAVALYIAAIPEAERQATQRRDDRPGRIHSQVLLPLRCPILTWANALDS